jgi:hypothetical protein
VFIADDSREGAEGHQKKLKQLKVENTSKVSRTDNTGGESETCLWKSLTAKE